MKQKQQRGFTLTELVVTMAIMTIITLAAGSVLVMTMHGVKINREMSASQFSSRQTLLTIVREVRSAVSDYELSGGSALADDGSGNPIWVEGVYVIDAVDLGNVPGQASNAVLGETPDSKLLVVYRPCLKKDLTTGEMAEVVVPVTLSGVDYSVQRTYYEIYYRSKKGELTVCRQLAYDDGTIGSTVTSSLGVKLETLDYLLEKEKGGNQLVDDAYTDPANVPKERYWLSITLNEAADLTQKGQDDRIVFPISTRIALTRTPS